MKKICFITGSRADYGLLTPLMSHIKNDKNLLILTHAATEKKILINSHETDKNLLTSTHENDLKLLK